MTQLIVYSAGAADVLLDTTDFALIKDELGSTGARLERWKAEQPLS